MEREKLTERRCQIRIYYSGRVQGVGFRQTAKTVAQGFEVVGRVRNLADGRVELIAEGPRVELEEYRLAMRASGLAGFIRDEQVEWRDVQNQYRTFEVDRSQ